MYDSRIVDRRFPYPWPIPVVATVVATMNVLGMAFGEYPDEVLSKAVQDLERLDKIFPGSVIHSVLEGAFAPRVSHHLSVKLNYDETAIPEPRSSGQREYLARIIMYELHKAMKIDTGKDLNPGTISVDAAKQNREIMNGGRQAEITLHLTPERTRILLDVYEQYPDIARIFLDAGNTIRNFDDRDGLVAWYYPGYDLTKNGIVAGITGGIPLKSNGGLLGDVKQYAESLGSRRG